MSSPTGSPAPARGPRWRNWLIWNWKGAVLGAVFRGLIFLAVNFNAGRAAALAAMGTQAGFRLTIGGVTAGLIERLCGVQPPWLGATLAFAIVPAFVHGMEFVVHRQAGTPRMALGETVSVSVTVVSTAFQLFAMRRGAFIAGDGAKSLAADMIALPRLIVEFVRSIF
ncbi:MAG TPA: hypothetical protein VFY29_12820, partial [Terriglobia bacterium]|nr:hypothetical protein [Terriglobia bacterium]